MMPKIANKCFCFFHSEEDEGKTRIHEEQWLKVQYPLAKIQLATIYPIKVKRAKACTVVDQITGRVFESAGHVIGGENGCGIVKLRW